ncbi:MAG: hypothetical protein ABIG03_00240 [Candidatus Eisenbacteria bacterium]
MISSTRRPAVAATAAALLALVLTAGCTGRNSFGPGDAAEEYELRTSPANVLAKMTAAYMRMDDDAYLDCLAESFVFHLNPDDVEDPEGQLPEYWGKADERTIHEAMFGESTNVTRVTLTLTNVSMTFSQGENPGDPMDDTWTFREQTDLRVTVLNDLTYLANSDQEFVFRMDPDETGPDGETLWEIIDWYDLRDERVEDSTWGSVKSMYR